MFGKHYAENLLENKPSSFYDDEVAMLEFDLYSCYKERSVPK